MEPNNDKLLRLLDMTEHPEKYSEQELHDILNDPDLRTDYEVMSRAREAFAKRNANNESVSDDVIDDEWEKLSNRISEERRVKSEERKEISEERGVKSEEFADAMGKNHSSFFTLRSSFFTFHSSLSKIAAVFIGFILISVLSIAAIHLLRGGSKPDNQTTVAVKDSVQKEKTVEAQPVAKDSTKTAVQKRFEDVELQVMLKEMAQYYNVKVDFQNAGACHLRMHFLWNQKDGVEEVANQLNQFNQVSIAFADNTITVK
jgi:hypothetical protein